MVPPHIVACPDDDAPRLVWADALTQQGDPRGEIITVQCALARASATDEDVGDLSRLANRERALLKTHLAQWVSPAEQACHGTYSLRRGLVEHVATDDTDSLVTGLEGLRRVEPLLRSVRIDSQDITTFALAPGAAAFEELELDGAVLDDVAAAFDASPWLGGLRRLAFHKAVLTSRQCRALLKLPQPIKKLELGFDGRLSTQVRSEVFSSLTSCEPRQRLESLVIRQARHLNGIGKYLRLLPELRSLSFENGDFEAGGLLALATSQLVALDVSDNYGSAPLKKFDLAELLSKAPALRRLRLSKMGLTDAHAIRLASEPSAARLTRLDLSRNLIGDAGALAIACSEHLQGLRRLSLSANALSAETKTALKESPYLRQAHLQLR